MADDPPRFVSDASAILAILLDEPGGPAAVDRATGSIMSTVNLSEVLQKATQRGRDMQEARLVIALLDLQVLAFSEAQAEEAARLWPSTSRLGLSFGDRACLALALERNATVLTAERTWARLDVGIRMSVIR
ncbi:MAG: type II toxin-antitoxin system VapC family toxin [Chloroflexi bacterium]|nr:type II toxin-antitoxin system VapC family toxin [Chloroflexota bacterium]